MKTEQSPPVTIDEYIAGFPPKIQTLLKKLRKTIQAAAPDAGEAIKYGMPTFTLNGNLIHFAAFTSHIGVYPTPIGMARFAEEVAPYAAGKGTLQFPHDQPIPYDLIGRIAAFRAESARAAKKPRAAAATRTPKATTPGTAKSPKATKSSKAAKPPKSTPVPAPAPAPAPKKTRASRKSGS